MLHVMTVVGTRPEIIRLSVLMQRLDQFFKHTLVHTGQNYDFELNEIFFKDLGLRNPDLYLSAAGETYSQTIARIIERGASIIRERKPDALLILGDTNSALIAIPAKREKIPVFHMEAGNRCFNDNVPEEINRRIVDQIADVNLPYTRIAKEYLTREGIHPQRIVCTGSPLPEVIRQYEDKINQSDICNKLGLTQGKYFVFSSHREENVDSNTRLLELVELLRKLISCYSFPVIFSVHPRTRARLDSYRIQLPEQVRTYPPFSYTDYLSLQSNSFAVLSDSGTISEEAAILRFPALNLRYSHERPEALETGTLPLCGFDFDKIYTALTLITSEFGIQRHSFSLPDDYRSYDFSMIVINTLLSYFRGATHSGQLR